MRVFQSFWQAGFESACHINRYGVRLDMIAATQHDRLADADYAMLAEAGFRTARDGCRWHLIDRGGQYDFTPLRPLAEAAERHNVQVIWNLCHYGWPDGLDILKPEFVDRFARYAGSVARFLKDHTSRVPLFCPINEISFFCWAAARFFYPFAEGQDDAIKHQLVRATIAACESIWGVEPRARFLLADPIINVVAPPGRPDLEEPAARHREAQFEAWDMLAGRKQPSLGGNPKYLDILGANYYYDNQWEIPDKKLAWDAVPLDSRWVPLHRQLQNLYERYGRPVVVAETSHFGRLRGRWIRGVANEVKLALEAGVPVEGICIYPILDRHDWEDPKWWHHSGLWDLRRDREGNLRRVLNRGYAAGLRRAREVLPGV
ncbi:MAG: beta-glucosidase [Rhodospirillales bacterium]